MTWLSWGWEIGQADLPYAAPSQPHWTWVPGDNATLCFRMRGTKVYKLSHAPPLLLVSNAAEPGLCVPRRLTTVKHPTPARAIVELPLSNYHSRCTNQMCQGRKLELAGS
jgi:hypothetical protein